jgi:hypothetical protein
MRCANTRSTSDKCGFCRELPPNGRGIYGRNNIPPGIARSGTMNPQDEWDSAGNYKLIDKEYTRGSGFHRELPDNLRWFRPVKSKCTENPQNGNNSRISSSKSYILTMPTLKKFKYEDLIKLKINLIRPY